MIFQNLFKHADLVLKKQCLLSILKTVLPLIFLRKLWYNIFRILFSSKNNIYLKQKSFFTVTFNQFSASLLNTNIFFILTDPSWTSE